MIVGHRKGGSHSLAKLEELTLQNRGWTRREVAKNRVINWVTGAPGLEVGLLIGQMLNKDYFCILKQMKGVILNVSNTNR